MKAIRLAAVLLAAAPDAGALEASPPTEAAVFIRVIGTVRAEYQRVFKERLQGQDVELATGSGFVVSSSGYVLTSHHVVSGQNLRLGREGRRVEVNLEVTRIEVVSPDGRRYEARVHASDPDLDLAVLSVSGDGLPFVSLGDSDALAAGQPVQAIGFPFGRSLEVARDVSEETVPQPTVSRGSVAALRSSETGASRYIQTDAVVHRGSSGGPLVDDDGRAVGVVRMGLASGSGVAFAVPINLAKDLLVGSGLEHVFPGRRLRLGPVQPFEWKRLRLRTPEDLEDTSPTRLRVTWGVPPQEVALIVDRVATPRSAAELERALLAGNLFAGFVASGPPDRRPLPREARPMLAGSAQGELAGGDGSAAEMEYAVVDLGAEKVVARYLGPADQVAFNRSVFVGSIQSLEADPLLTAEVKAPVQAVLEPAALPHPEAGAILMPRGWTREPASGSDCRELPPADSALASSPDGDFTVSLRASWWRGAPAAAEEARAACRLSMGAHGPASYSRRARVLGVENAIDGTFVNRPDGLWRLEVQAPVAKAPFLREVYLAWVKALTPAR